MDSHSPSLLQRVFCDERQICGRLMRNILHTDTTCGVSLYPLLILTEICREDWRDLHSPSQSMQVIQASAAPFCSMLSACFYLLCCKCLGDILEDVPRFLEVLDFGLLKLRMLPHLPVFWPLHELNRSWWSWRALPGSLRQSRATPEQCSHL